MAIDVQEAAADYERGDVGKLLRSKRSKIFNYELPVLETAVTTAEQNLERAKDALKKRQVLVDDLDRAIENLGGVNV